MAKAWVLQPLALPHLSASATAPGSSIVLATNDYAGVVYRSPGGADAVTITIDMERTEAVDAALFFGCSGAEPGWLLSVESADDGAFAVNAALLATGIPFLAGVEMPSHGRGVGYWESSAPVTPRRWWRFTIYALGGAAVVIARIAIGRKLTLERNFAFGVGWGVRDFGTVDYSPRGVRMRRRAAKLRTLGLTFPAVTKDEVESKVQPLIEAVGGQAPIVIVTDPAPHAMRQRRCWIGTMTGELGTVWRSATGWEWRAALIDLIPIGEDR